MESKELELELKKWQKGLDIKFGESTHLFKIKKSEEICGMLNYLFENFKVLLYFPEGGNVFNFGKVWCQNNEIRMLDNYDKDSCITIFEPEELEYNKIGNNGNLSYIRIKIKEGESKTNSPIGFPDEYIELNDGKILGSYDDLNGVSEKAKSELKTVTRFFTGSFLIVSKFSSYKDYEKLYNSLDYFESNNNTKVLGYHDTLNFDEFREKMKIKGASI